jgi:hypothetical protein
MVQSEHRVRFLHFGFDFALFLKKPNKDRHSLASFFQINFSGKSHAGKPTADAETLSLICQQIEGGIGRATDAKWEQRTGC